MKCREPIFLESKKNIIRLSSAELAQRVVKDILNVILFVGRGPPNVVKN